MNLSVWLAMPDSSFGKENGEIFFQVSPGAALFKNLPSIPVM